MSEPRTTQFMMASAVVAQWFREHGEEQQVSAKYPFLLNAPDTVWLVDQGRVELFTVAVEDGEPVGPRENFATIEPGQVIFGMDLDSYGMGSGFLAVGQLGTRLFKAQLEDLRALGQDPKMTLGLASAVDLWVRKLTYSLTRAVPQPRVDVNMVDQEPVALDSELKARANHGVLWIGGEAELLYVGMESIDLSAPAVLFPITQDSWVETVQVREEIELVGHSSLRVLGDPRLWAGLASFHEVLCTCEFINKKLAVVDEYNRLEDKSAQSAEARDKAYEQIYSVMTRPGQRARAVEISADEHPFGAACRLVGAAQGIDVEVPTRIEETPAAEERIQLVAKASRFRTRAVALKGDWYRFDQGPILAQIDDAEPVALLPLSPHSYEYIVPATGERGPVDAAFNERLGVFGAVFYRPFPDGPITAGGLLKFGARGLGKDIATLLIMGVALGGLGALTPIFTGKVFDEAIPQAERGLLVQFALGLLVASIVSVAFTITQRIATLRIQGKMDYAIQAAVWDRLLDLPTRFFGDYEAGDLADRAAGINRIRGLLAGAGVSAILGSLSSVFYIVLLFVYSVPLALIAMALTAVFVAFTFIANYSQIRLQRQQLTLNGKIASLVLQLLSGVAKLRTTGSENHAFYTWSVDFATTRRLSFRIGTIQNFVQTFNSAFPVLASMAIFSGVVFLTGGAETAEQSMTTGDFIAFNAAFGAFMTASLALSDASLNLLRALPMYERLKPIITTVAEVDNTKEPPGDLTGEIEVSHAHFRYAPDGPWILKDVSLKIRPGEFVAFVGGSGSGKSTLMRLIVGFESPEKGTVYFDGKDLSTLDIRGVRQQMGVVLQDSQVLPVDIFRNIVGTSSLTEQDAWEAARKVGLDKDIRQMPMGMHTYVMEGGGGFSGGQIQRLLLARAVVHNPRIIILDEATSALDNKTQAIVTESMNRMQATRIAIAHRLSTIVDADTIYVLEKGEIIESGSYDELMELDGRFAELARRQIA